jgi:hypothetical protein
VRHIYLSLDCTHGRATRSTYDSYELKHPERWVGTLVQCDKCGKLSKVLGISKTEQWLETFLGVLEYVEREGKKSRKRNKVLSTKTQAG